MSKVNIHIKKKFDKDECIYVGLVENELSSVDKNQKLFYEQLRLGKTGKSYESRVNRLWRLSRRSHYLYSNKNIKEIIFRQLNLQIKKNRKINVLEIGCAAGTFFSKACMQLGEKCHFVGVELAYNQLRLLCNKFDCNGFSNYTLINDTILSDIFSDKQFHLIYAGGIFHHIVKSERTKLYKKLNYLLTDDGQLVACEPLNINPILSLARKLTRRMRPNLAWEHPFSNEDIYEFKEQFKVLEFFFKDGFTIFAIFMSPFYALHKLFYSILSELDEILIAKPYFRFLASRFIAICKKNE